MKQEKPELRKRSDSVSYLHMQMPKWLFTEGKYNGLSLYAKVAYTFLLDRFQLSRQNGWVTDNDEVFVIYTREELAAEMGVGAKRATATFQELKRAGLIWEQRRGRGLANYIFLVSAPHEEQPYVSRKSPHAGSQKAQTAALEAAPKGSPEAVTEAAPKGSPKASLKAAPSTTSAAAPSKAAEGRVFLPKEDPHKTPSKTRAASRSGTAKPAGQDLSQMRPNKNNRNYPDEIEKERKLVEAQQEAQELQDLYRTAELSEFRINEQKLIKDCIAWLYYAGEVRIGACNYPQNYVRSRLWELDSEIVQAALDRMHENPKEVRRNSNVYAAKILFSCLAEQRSWLALDPYLNGVKPAVKAVRQEDEWL